MTGPSLRMQANPLTAGHHSCCRLRKFYIFHLFSKWEAHVVQWAVHRHSAILNFILKYYVIFRFKSPWNWIITNLPVPALPRECMMTSMMLWHNDKYVCTCVNWDSSWILRLQNVGWKESVKCLLLSLYSRREHLSYSSINDQLSYLLVPFIQSLFFLSSKNSHIPWPLFFGLILIQTF